MRAHLCTAYERRSSPAGFRRGTRGRSFGMHSRDTSEQTLLHAMRAALDQCARTSSRAPRIGLATQPDNASCVLSSREREVITLLAQGRTNPAIASAFGLRIGTVKEYIERIFNKLDVTDRTSAVVRAIELGIVPVPKMDVRQ
jgi:DNA-binding NarL/FixJ family response regulator